MDLIGLSMDCHSIIVFLFCVAAVPLSALTVIDLVPDYYFITTGSQYSHSAGGVGDSPAKPKCGVTCTKSNSGMIFYSSNLSLRGPRGLNYIAAFANGVIPCPGSPQVITNNATDEPILGEVKSMYR